MATATSRKRLAHYTHSHYQTDKVLYVEIQAAGLSASEVTSSFAEDRVHVHIDRESPAEAFTYEITPFAAIRAAKCTCTLKPDRVVLKIFKKEAAEWEVIFRKKEKAAEAATTTGGDALPKAYATQRDWEEIDRNLAKELEAEKPKDEAALNKLFEDIYARADPDTRRAMVKSMQTSGGTVLSTNWNEVKVRVLRIMTTHGRRNSWSWWHHDARTQTRPRDAVDAGGATLRLWLWVRAAVCVVAPDALTRCCCFSLCIFFCVSSSFRVSSRRKRTTRARTASRRRAWYGRNSGRSETGWLMLPRVPCASSWWVLCVFR